MNKSNKRLVDRILQDSDPNIPDAQGNTPLMKVILRIVEKRSQKKTKKLKNPFKLEIRMAKKLIEKGADSAIKNKAGQNALTLIMENSSYSDSLADSKGISELIGLLWENFSFIKDPKAFFSFNKNILSPDTQTMICTLIEKSIKESREQKEESKSADGDVEMKDDMEEAIKTDSKKLPYKVINTLDEEGFTPFLRYIEVFTSQGRSLYEKLEKHITTEDQLDEIDISSLLNNSKSNSLFANSNANNNGSILGGFNQNNNVGFGGGLFGNNNAGSVFGNNSSTKQKELALKLFDNKISKPFAQFLERLIEFGADQHMQVDKTEQYRNTSDDLTIIRKRDNMGNVMNQYSDKGLSNALHLMLEFPSKTVFDLILDSGVSTEEINIKKMTPFFMLIKTKDTTNPEYKYCLDKFISTKADIDSPDQFGVSAFWHCYQNQKVDLALYLASKGADINRIDNYGFFALKSEVFNNNLERIRQLIGVGADVNKQDEFQRTVLHHAFNRYRIGNDLAIIKYLLGNGANVNERDFKSRTPLHYLFVKSNRRFNNDPNDPASVIVEVVNQCNEINLTQQDNNGNTILHYICQRQAIECLKLLKGVIKDKDFDIQNNDGNSPFAIGLINNHENIIRYILNNFSVDLNGHCYKPQRSPNQSGNNVQGEESDFEFMMTVEVQLEQKEKEERMKKRKSYFEYCVNKQELYNLVKVLLDKGYSISRAFKDAFKAGNYQQLFQLLKTMDQETVKTAVKIKDEFGRNIFHALSKAPDQSPFDDICKILIEDYELDANEGDNQGNTPIMLACQNGKLNLVKALECIGCNIKDTNDKSENCIHMLMRGKKIKRYSRAMLKYLLNSSIDFNAQYEESEYLPAKVPKSTANKEIVYKCTPLIHLIRTPLIPIWDKADLLDEIFDQNEQRINPNQTDSDGRDVFMHIALLNEYECFKFILKKVKLNYKNTPQNEEEKKMDVKMSQDKDDGLINALKQSKGKTNDVQKVNGHSNEHAGDEEEEIIITNKYELMRIERLKSQKQEPEVTPIKEQPKVKQVDAKFGIDLMRKDNFGKSLVHYIVTPVDYGSFENFEFLKRALKYGFAGGMLDNDNKKPYEYALGQTTGFMLKVFQEFGLAPSTANTDSSIKSYRKIEDWEKVDYNKDAQDFLDLVQMKLDKTDNIVPCDSVGKFNDDCRVYEDSEKGFYDCHLTRVDIGREEKDDYLFYKMQIVHDTGRDLWMLFTRWGRIGEEGAFQKTPYSKQECIDEFEKIFLSKTKNEWKDRENFKKHWFKYQLINVNYSSVSHEDYLVPFDLANSKESNLHPSVREAMKEITQVAMYVKGLKDSGIDIKQMPFSNINRNDLLKARKSLTKLREILEELEPMEANFNRLNNNPIQNDRNKFDKVGKDKIISLRESMWYHSSRFYEMIPHEEFNNEIVPPIKTTAMLKQKADMIDNLLNFEMASKILLGAHKNAKETNPLDYCMKAMGVDIDVLDKQTEEFKILKEYCVRTWPENKLASRKIRNIFKIQRKSEGEAYEAYEHLDNKYLLFHGTRISNFMGIMSQGLRVAPPEAPKTGYMFGKGVYFADMLQKSFNYCSDFNASADCSKFMLLCETALGKSYKLTHAQYMDEPPEGYDSTQGCGRMGPDYSKCFTFPEGYKIPKGNYLEYEYEGEFKDRIYLNHNEYIIYKNTGNKIDQTKNVEKQDSNPGQIKMRYLIQLK